MQLQQLLLQMRSHKVIAFALASIFRIILSKLIWLSNFDVTD